MREKGDYVEYFIPDVQAQAYIVQKDQPYSKLNGWCGQKAYPAATAIWYFYAVTHR